MNVAVPADTVPVPNVVAPSRNVTVPVSAATVVLPVTVAVNVTDWPNTDGFAEEATVVVVVAGVTVRGSQALVVGPLLASPLYEAWKLKEVAEAGVVAEESGTALAAPIVTGCVVAAGAEQTPLLKKL